MSTTDNAQAVQQKTLRHFGGLLQLLAIGLSFELLLGISDGIGMMLRFFLLAVVISCVAFRLGWLSLAALQISLLIQEPRRQQFDQAPSGLYFALVAMFAVVAAMKLPHTHRFVTDYLLKLFNMGPYRDKSTYGTQRLAISALHMTVVTILSLFLLTKLPIRRQSEIWLRWSLENGQAVWPGALLLSLMIAALVVVREIAWRQLDRSQASLYLRSVQMIANYRDLYRFERQRRVQLRNVQSSSQQSTTVVASRTKIRRRKGHFSANATSAKRL